MCQQTASYSIQTTEFTLSFTTVCLRVKWKATGENTDVRFKGPDLTIKTTSSDVV
jgi:hypothetical protein